MADITKNLIEITRNPSQDLVTKIKQRHRAAGQEATGRTSALLHIEYKDNGFQLVGWEYSGTYEEGRKPGKMPPPQVLINWAYAKGLKFKTEAQAKSWAYCLARKIAREGTQRYRLAQQGKPVDIFQTPIAEMKEKINAQVAFYLSHEIQRELLRIDPKRK